MYHESFAAFLAMGGYGLYVWLAYGITTVCLLGLLLTSWYQKKALLTAYRKAAAQEQRRHAASTQGDTL